MARKSKNQSKTHWRGVLRALKKSGLGVAAFCRKKGIKPASLYAWRRQMGEARKQKGAKMEHEAFVPVQVVTGDEGRPVLEVALKNGRVLRLFSEVPALALAELIRAAETC